MNSRLTIRETTPTDRENVLAVIEAAFGGADEANLVDALWQEDAIALDLVALEDSKVIGHCAFSQITAKPAIKGAALGLAPVSVAPDRQRSGVGAALIETGLDICKTRGVKLVVVLGEPAYYSRFGFRPGARQNISWAALDAGDAFQILDWAGLGDTPRQVHYHPLFSAT
ncbi:MAG: N-acetyltransferase [Pseudomonadota bacterium]